MEDLSLADYLAILKWRKKYFLLAFFALWSCSLIFAMCWSNYRSTATVEIEASQIAADATTPIGMNPAEGAEALADLRIGKIQQKVTTPASLVDIISKFDLYPEARKYEPVVNIATRMRNRVKLELLSTAIANPAATSKVPVDQLSAIAFTLSFDYGDPHVAQEVTNELVTRFLDEDLKERRSEAEQTSAFLGSQITTLETSMADQEKKMAEFQEAHGISRPETLMFNQQAAANTMLTLQSLDSQIAANQGTQGSLRAQLAVVDPYSRVIADGQVLTTPETQLKALQAQYATLTAQYGPDHPDVVKTRHQIDSLRKETGIQGTDTGQLRAQINDTKTNLEAAKKTYGPDHPDAIALQHKLDTLQQKLGAVGSDEMPNSAIKHDADNPGYLQLVAQLMSAQEQQRTLVAQKEVLAKQQVKYQAAVSNDPGLQQQMASLSRDYDNAQLRYRELKEKKMAADMDVQMVQDRQGQRLNVISPPDLPLKTHPSRMLIIIGGFLFSVMGGFGCVILVQALSRSVLGARHLTALVGVPPLVAIPHIYTRNEAKRERRRRSFMVSATICLAVVTVIVFNFAVMPLDVAWSIFTQRLGLS